MEKDKGFIKDKRLFLLDIDGTVCIGQRLIDGNPGIFKGSEKKAADSLSLLPITLQEVSRITSCLFRNWG